MRMGCGEREVGLLEGAGGKGGGGGRRIPRESVYTKLERSVERTGKRDPVR